MWKEVNPISDRTWNPHEEKEIEGTLISIKKEQGPNKSMVYVIDVGEEKVSIWGTTVLDSKMAAVSENSKIKIIFNGLKDSPKRKGKQYKDFSVLVDTEDQTIVKQEKPLEESEEIQSEDIPF